MREIGIIEYRAGDYIYIRRRLTSTVIFAHQDDVAPSIIEIKNGVSVTFIVRENPFIHQKQALDVRLASEDSEYKPELLTEQMQKQLLVDPHGHVQQRQQLIAKQQRQQLIAEQQRHEQQRQQLIAEQRQQLIAEQQNQQLIAEWNRKQQLIMAQYEEQLQAEQVQEEQQRQYEQEQRASHSRGINGKYINHCWNCSAHIDSDSNQQCMACTLFFCNTCGVCLCDRVT